MVSVELAPEPEEGPRLAVVARLDRKLALDRDAGLQILWECGFLRGHTGVVNLGKSYKASTLRN